MHCYKRDVSIVLVKWSLRLLCYSLCLLAILSAVTIEHTEVWAVGGDRIQVPGLNSQLALTLDLLSYICITFILTFPRCDLRQMKERRHPGQG